MSETIGLIFGWVALGAGLFFISGIAYLFWTWKRDGKCTHEIVRCVHGDEIRYSGYRRGFCLDCHMYLDKLPSICSTTGKEHLNA